MNENRLPDSIDHILQAAAGACSFVEGLGKDAFLEDKRATHCGLRFFSQANQRDPKQYHATGFDQRMA